MYLRSCVVLMLVGCTSSERREPEAARPVATVVTPPVAPVVAPPAPPTPPAPPKPAPPPPTTWLAQWAGPNFDEVHALAISGTNETLAVGSVAGAMTLRSAGGEPTSVMVPMLDFHHAGMLVKYGAHGELRFAVPFTLGEHAEGVAATPDGGAVVVGSKGTPQVHVPGEEFVREEPDGHVARFDASGQLVWRTQFDGPSTQTITEVAAHPQGGYVIAGTFHGPSRFDRDPGKHSFGAGMKPENPYELGISYDVFVARLDEGGEVMWIGEVGGDSQEVLGGLAVAADGTVVMTGDCREVTRVKGGGTRLKITCGELSIGGFLAAWRADGELQWASRIPGPERDEQSPKGVAVLADGTVVVVGMFKAAIGGGKLPALKNAHSGYDGFVVGYTAQGEPAWLRHVGGPGSEVLHAAAAAPGGDVWVIGQASADMEFGDGSQYTKEVPRGGNNGLLLRYDGKGGLLRAELFGGKPAPKESTPTVADADFSEIRAYGLAVLPDGALRIGGSFDGGLVLPVPGGETLRQRTTALLDAFVIARPAP